MKLQQLLILPLLLVVNLASSFGYYSIDENKSDLFYANNDTLINQIRETTPVRKKLLDYEKAFPFKLSLTEMPTSILELIKYTEIENLNNTLDTSLKRYSLLDHFENKQTFYFRVIEENEYCCRIIYLVYYDKLTSQVSSISYFGIYGGDGGWETTSTESWESESILTLKKLVINDYDNIDDSYIEKKDSLTYRYEILSSKINVTLLDSVRTETVIR
ncbi:hypothetical protein [Flammeovirga sp. SubArs3]|uniref:hypothetical protein n=1 Tax=Flammeovirga sp. SubArs3 TaxID=2995316 RepID=UPI00248BBCA1|nr:hypothetical protein [Flammeovirga sp. SubArs3]